MHSEKYSGFNFNFWKSWVRTFSSIVWNEIVLLKSLYFSTIFRSSDVMNAPLNLKYFIIYSKFECFKIL